MGLIFSRLFLNIGRKRKIESIKYFFEIVRKIPDYSKYYRSTLLKKSILGIIKNKNCKISSSNKYKKAIRFRTFKLKKTTIQSFQHFFEKRLASKEKLYEANKIYINLLANKSFYFLKANIQQEKEKMNLANSFYQNFWIKKLPFYLKHLLSFAHFRKAQRTEMMYYFRTIEKAHLRNIIQYWHLYKEKKKKKVH